MSIKKLMLTGEENKKILSKSFRLRPQAMDALEKLSEKTGISQNESLNIILEESLKDYEALEEVERVLEKNGRVEIYKILFASCYFEIILRSDDSQNSGINCNLRIYRKDFPFDPIGEVYLDLALPIEEVKDILNLGFDSSFNISGGTIFQF